MPKQSSRAQHPPSPGTAGAASVDQNRSVPVEGGAAAESRENRIAGLDINKRSLSGADCWTRELDQVLTDAIKAGRNERECIRLVQQAYPSLSKTLIWERIAYLELNVRTRPPYQEHLWTEIEDNIPPRRVPQWTQRRALRHQQDSGSACGLVA